MKDGLARQYRSGTLEKGLDLLETLERSAEPLRLQELTQVTGQDRATLFRLLCTLEDRGYLERMEDKRYRAKPRKRAPRVLYIAPLSGNAFREAVTTSVRRSAADAGLQLELIDTSDSTGVSVGFERAVASHPDAVILFQKRGSLAHVLADRFLQEQIPVISVDTPVAGALYFGGNSFRAGILAGKALGDFARNSWSGEFDRLLLMESSLSAPENMARLTGAVEGAQQILGPIPEKKILHVDGLSSQEASYEACRSALAKLPARFRILVSCFNDPTALGALEAANALKRSSRIAIVGQNGTRESRAELLSTSSALIASVAYFPERYGDHLMKMVAAATAHQSTPLAVYVDHVLLTHRNIRSHYPTA